MKKLYIFRLFYFSLLLSLFNCSLNAEEIESNSSKNAIYYELLGSAGYLYNATYDRIVISKSSYKISLALGVQYEFYGYLGLSAQNSISPQIQYIRGKYHNLELGFGYFWDIKYGPVNVYIFRIGYRYQKKNRVFFKIALTPILWDAGFFYSEKWEIFPFTGLSLGYAF